MTKWTVALDRETCGYDAKPIGQGNPMQLITLPGVMRVRRRCERHRLEGTEVDEAQVADARAKLAERQLNVEPMKLSAYRPVVNLRRQSKKAREAEKTFQSLGSIGKSVASTFDPKMRAANDTEF